MFDSWWFNFAVVIMEPIDPETERERRQGAIGFAGLLGWITLVLGIWIFYDLIELWIHHKAVVIVLLKTEGWWCQIGSGDYTDLLWWNDINN